MDVDLAVASKRDSREYSGGPVSDQAVRRILDAGRLAGSARNRQPCRFVVPEGEAVPAVADAVYRSSNVVDAGLVAVIVVSPGGGLVDFDAGRTAQNMMLAAWAEGIASCPNGIADPELLATARSTSMREQVRRPPGVRRRWGGRCATRRTACPRSARGRRACPCG